MLVLGGLLSCAAVLAIAVFALIFRNPNPPRWTTYSWAGELSAVALVCVLAVGVGYLSSGAISAYQQGLSLVDLALLAVVLAVAAVVWRKLDVRARLKAMEGAVSVPAFGAMREAVAATDGVAATTPEPPPSRPAPRVA
jgi:choline-glycine betaine transporter